jgi:VWFA-related protein
VRESILIGLAFAAALSAQEPTFQTGISIVEIDLQVFDRNGIINGLNRDDFIVKDNGQPVALRYCSQEEQPLDIVFLFELSKMMAPNSAKLRGAAEAAIAALRPGDRAAAFSFSEPVRMEMPLTSDLDAVKRTLRFGLAYATFAGKPFVLPAAVEAAGYLAKEPAQHRRKAILMAGADAGFGVTQQSHSWLTRRLWGEGAILSAVVIPSSWTRLINDDNPYRIFGMISAGINRFDNVDDIADQTGGETLYTDDAGPMKRTPEPYIEVRRMIERMRRRYALYYDMPDAKPGERRRVAIELSAAARAAHPDARVIWQRGYVVPKRGAALPGVTSRD